MIEDSPIDNNGTGYFFENSTNDFAKSLSYASEGSKLRFPR
jgi:hypothetical protein